MPHGESPTTPPPPPSPAAPESPPSRPAHPPPAPRDPDGVTREVRFAVVMYGGVSLCVYMNGIAQELLNLVRATAGDDGGLRRADAELTRVERVYRRLGRLLTQERAAGQDVAPDAPVRTRFSVDVLSGTSAGGINSIFLAKALANDEQMLQLKQLWITEGDIARLINDRGSTQDTALPHPDAPEALLNGERMYQKLVQAFDGMDDEAGVDRGTPPRPPLVPELDLFVTATDIAGVPLPLRLADGVVHERRHRGVFHFRYKSLGPGAAEPNELGREYNPFLAFAARCTSAFPFAFQPMRLADVDRVLDSLDAYRGRPEGRADDPRWKPLMERFRTPPGTAQVDPRLRSFGDGGYLDNKPFSWATEALLRREAQVPVDRKLLYIEPAPEHPERDPARTERPDAVENVLAATVGLPRYETIREDLEHVLARNRLTARVRTITEEVENDIPGIRARQALRPAPEWGPLYLDEMVEAHGLAYGGYHRLRVAATTDRLALVVARAADLGEGSDLLLSIRFLVRAWRERHHTPHRPGGTDARASENQFLLDYDLSFRSRRVGYLLGKINWLHGLDRQAEAAVWKVAEQLDLPVEDGMPARSLTEEQRAEFRDELVALKGAFHAAYRAMRREEERMERRGAGNPFHEPVRRLGLHAAELTRLLELSTTAREEEAHLLLGADGREQALADFAAQVREVVREARAPASAAVESLLHPRAAPAASPARRLARGVLWHYYSHYGDYDMVSFPILYSTEAGEQDTVDVIRVSPEDATFILDEKSDPLGRRKLAGTALFSFGGFMQDAWRANDVLWGRLDGAERLIRALLPDGGDAPLRHALLEEASLAILEEEFKSATRAEVSRLMSESLVHVAAGRAPESAVARLTGRIGNEQLPTRLEAVFGECLDERELLAYFRESYEVNRDLDPQVSLGVLARGSRVVGRMLEGISERHTREGRRVRWLTRAAEWFWGMVQVAVPRSLPSLLFDHWLGLFYTLAVLMIVVGVFAGGEVMGWGARILVAALGAHGVVLLFRDLMQRRGRVAAVAAALAVCIVGGLVAAWAWWVSRAALSLALSREGLRQAQASAGLESWGGPHTVQVLGYALGGLILLATLPALLRRPWSTYLPGGFAQPMLAAEFVRDADELAKLTRGRLVPPAPAAPTPPSAAERALDARLRRVRDRQGDIPRNIRRGVYVDYLFIAAYWILFLLLADRLVALALADGLALHAAPVARLLGAGPGAVRGVLETALLIAGVAAGLTGTAAALLDLVENGRIHEAFTAGRGREEDWMALGIRQAAAWKWALVFVTVALLSPLFLLSPETAQRVLGAAWVAVAALGLWAATRRPRMLEWAFPALGAGLLAAAYLLGRG